MYKLNHPKGKEIVEFLFNCLPFDIDELPEKELCKYESYLFDDEWHDFVNLVVSDSDVIDGETNPDTVDIFKLKVEVLNQYKFE